MARKNALMDAEFTSFLATSVSAGMGNAVSIVFRIAHLSAETNILWHFFRIVVITFWTEPSNELVDLTLGEVSRVLFNPFLDTV